MLKGSLNPSAYHQLIEFLVDSKLYEGMKLIFSAFDEQTAQDIPRQRYEPYDFYNPDSDELESDVITFLTQKDTMQFGMRAEV